MKRKPKDLVPFNPPAAEYLFSCYDVAMDAVCAADEQQRHAEAFAEHITSIRDAITALAYASKLGELQPWQVPIVAELFASLGKVKFTGKVGAA